MSDMNMTYKQWMMEIDDLCRHHFGSQVVDGLSELDSRRLYKSGATPRQGFQAWIDANAITMKPDDFFRS